VFHHDHAVPQVAQPPQGGDQAQVVALVQSDRWLVQHVHDPGQLRAELRRQTNALRLTARQRRRGAIEGQVLQPHVQQEPQPRVHLLEDLAGDLGPRPGQPQALEVRVRRRHRHRGDLDEALLGQ
jgi:hypothetical protein